VVWAFTLIAFEVLVDSEEGVWLEIRRTGQTMPLLPELSEAEAVERVLPLELVDFEVQLMVLSAISMVSSVLAIPPNPSNRHRVLAWAI
jgi:hypothetical protein